MLNKSSLLPLPGLTISQSQVSLTVQSTFELRSTSMFPLSAQALNSTLPQPDRGYVHVVLMRTGVTLGGAS